MVLVKNWQFFHVFNLGKIDHENVFHDVRERKNAFLGYEKQKFNTSKNFDFSKGVSPWFWSKIGNFSTFLFEGKYSITMCLGIV